MVKEDTLYRFLSRIRGNRDAIRETDLQISEVMDLIRGGMDLATVRKRLKLDSGSAGILFEIASARISLRNKFTLWDRLWMDHYLARYSTPEEICRYRSGRIRGYDVVDIGSGGGIQTVFFSKSNNSAIGIELNPARHIMSEINSTIYHGDNVSFVRGDALEYIGEMKINSETVIFSDPARPPGSPERTLEELHPSPLKIYDMLRGRTENLVFDLPPQMRWEKISIAGEKEYASIGGQLNRLTLYSSSLRQCEVSAVVLPQNIRVEGEPGEVPVQPDTEILDYILVVDPAVARARLVHVVMGGMDGAAISDDGRRYIITSSDAPKEFPGEIYRTEFLTDANGLRDAIAGSDAARVIPRYRIEESAYYKHRDNLGSGLKGSRDIYLFAIGKRYVGCTRLS